MIWSGKMCVTSVNHTPYEHREVQFRVAIQTREEKGTIWVGCHCGT